MYPWRCLNTATPPPKSLYCIYTIQEAQCNTSHTLYTILPAFMVSRVYGFDPKPRLALLRPRCPQGDHQGQHPCRMVLALVSSSDRSSGWLAVDIDGLLHYSLIHLPSPQCRCYRWPRRPLGTLGCHCRGRPIITPSPLDARTIAPSPRPVAIIRSAAVFSFIPIGDQDCVALSTDPSTLDR